MIVVLGRPENGLDRNGYMKSNGQLLLYIYFFLQWPGNKSKESMEILF